jgi:hypothetical protein
VDKKCATNLFYVIIFFGVFGCSNTKINQYECNIKNIHRIEMSKYPIDSITSKSNEIDILVFKNQINKCMNSVSYNGRNQKLIFFRSYKYNNNFYIEYILSDSADVEYVFVVENRKIKGYFIK